MPGMELSINGKRRVVSSPDSTLLLWVLRDELGMTGTKIGCGAGICGACTVMLDGAATRSCITPLSGAAGKSITTIEGLAQDGALHPVQAAFVEQQVPQCGWCMSGQIMTAAAFLQNTPAPSAEQIDEALSRNYCRCGCYHRIRLAVAAAASATAAREKAREDEVAA
jgi:isoquinoline 1-oxidoreductase subunit alpha